MAGVVLGIDLGVTAGSELAVADGARVESTRKIASTIKGLVDGIKRAAAGREVSLVVESTAMAWFVAAVAAARAGIDHTLYRVSGRKAAALRSFYRTHTKTDRIDSRVLARMPHVDDTLRPFELAEPGELALKRLAVLRHKLTIDARRVLNRIRSMLHWAAPGLLQAAGGKVNDGLLKVLQRWPDLRLLARARVSTIAETSGWSVERADSVRLLAREAVSFYDGFVDLDSLTVEFEVALLQMNSVREQQRRLEARISSVHKQRHPDDPLLTLPGVGPVVAAIIRGVVGDLKRFTNLASFRAYTGLVPKEDSSGDRRQRGRISKAGPSVLRWALFLAADVARQWDPALAALYRRLMVERGRTHAQAVCAVATHLAGRVWAVVRDNRPYEWRALDGEPITRERARVIAMSMRVDEHTRARIKNQTLREPGESRTRQLESPQDTVRLSTQELIEAALEVAAARP